MQYSKIVWWLIALAVSNVFLALLAVRWFSMGAEGYDALYRSTVFAGIFLALAYYISRRKAFALYGAMALTTLASVLFLFVALPTALRLLGGTQALESLDLTPGTLAGDSTYFLLSTLLLAALYTGAAGLLWPAVIRHWRQRHNRLDDSIT